MHPFVDASVLEEMHVCAARHHVCEVWCVKTLTCLCDSSACAPGRGAENSKVTTMRGDLYSPPWIRRPHCTVK